MLLSVYSCGRLAQRRLSYTGPDTDPGEGQPGHEEYLPPDERPNFINWMTEKGITVDDELEAVKAYKLSLFKQISKRKNSRDKRA